VAADARRRPADRGRHRGRRRRHRRQPVNNLPATLFLLSGSHGAGLRAALRAPFLVGVLAGADLGPNLTPVGSLSTMLWLVIVRRKGLQVSALDYLKLGAVVTPLLLVVAWLGIGATFR
jgi:arsenical pump membrane protein